MIIKLLQLLYLEQMYHYLKKIHTSFLFLFIGQWYFLFVLGSSESLAASNHQSLAKEIKISISGCIILGYCINIESDKETPIEIILDLDTSGSFEKDGIDVKLKGNLKSGINCIRWDGYDSKGTAVSKTIVANIIAQIGVESYTNKVIIYSLCTPGLKDVIDSTTQNLPLIVKDTRLRSNGSFIETNDNKIVFKSLANVATSKGGVINMDTLGRYTYTPPKNFIGFDEFSYSIYYSLYPELIGTAKVKIKVISAGFETPIARNDYYTLKQNQVKSDNVINNDVGARICKYALSTDITVNGGKISLATNGSFTYTPPPDFVGQDSIAYQMCNAIVPELCSSAYIYFTVILQKEIIEPSGFTPNGDGINDFFEIQHIEQYDNEVKIFNRWGSLVYRATNYNNKDVKWEGRAAEGALLKNDLFEGTYFYLIDLKDGSPPRNGYVIIIK